MAVAFPTLADFIVFVRGQGVPVAAIPDASEYLSDSYEIAKDIVPSLLWQVSPISFRKALLNLAMHTLVHDAMDLPASTFFVDLRNRLGLNSFVGGIIVKAKNSVSNDEIAPNQEVARLSIADLQLTTTTWGTTYLMYASKTGGILACSR